MSSNKSWRINGHRFLIWRGWTGKWFWQYHDNRILCNPTASGEAASETEAREAAAAWLAKVTRSSARYW